MRTELLALLLILLMASTGCFTETAIYGDGLLPDDITVHFHLTDGS